LKKIDKNEIEVLYTTEGIPGLEKYKTLKKIIFQEVFPSDGFDLAEVVLPAVTFTEENGTITTQKGSLPILKMIRPPDLALDDWKIITKIARELDFSGFNYLDILEINQEMERTGKKAQMRAVDEHYLKYRGTFIADKVPEFKILLEYRKDRDKAW
jgi:anaerobic selenocysteine-containing dehydrogenase